MNDKTICRTDGRCEYAIQSGAEENGHCPNGKCAMPASAPGTGSDSLDCILGVGGFASFGPLDAQPAAHLTIPGALEWDGDNGTHGADGESRAHGESSELERLKEKLEAIRARPNSIDHSPTAMIPNALDAWGRPVPQHLPYDFSGNPGASAIQYCNGWNDSGSYWKNHVIDIEAQLASTEQSRRSFFDLSQDLEKRMAERVELQWIECKDRMPEPDVDVLVSYTPLGQEKAIVHSAFLNKAFDDMDHLFWFNGKGESMRGVVKHWMPMIALPDSAETPIEPAAFDDIPDFTAGSGNKAKRRIAAIEAAKPKTCTACDGWGTISTGIDEAPSTNCKKCDGTGKGGEQ